MKFGFNSVMSHVNICFVNINRNLKNDFEDNFLGGENMLSKWACQGTRPFDYISLPIKLEIEVYSVVS